MVGEIDVIFCYVMHYVTVCVPCILDILVEAHRNKAKVQNGRYLGKAELKFELKFDIYW